MKKAGGNPDVFSPEAVVKIFEASRGVPRIINMLCDTALVYGFADELIEISEDVVKHVIRDRGGMGMLTGRDSHSVDIKSHHNAQDLSPFDAKLEAMHQAWDESFKEYQAGAQLRLENLKYEIAELRSMIEELQNKQ